MKIIIAVAISSLLLTGCNRSSSSSPSPRAPATAEPQTDQPSTGANDQLTVGGTVVTGGGGGGGITGGLVINDAVTGGADGSGERTCGIIGDGNTGLERDSTATADTSADVDVDDAEPEFPDGFWLEESQEVREVLEIDNGEIRAYFDNGAATVDADDCWLVLVGGTDVNSVVVGDTSIVASTIVFTGSYSNGMSMYLTRVNGGGIVSTYRFLGEDRSDEEVQELNLYDGDEDGLERPETDF